MTSVSFHLSNALFQDYVHLGFIHVCQGVYVLRWDNVILELKDFERGIQVLGWNVRIFICEICKFRHIQMAVIYVFFNKLTKIGELGSTQNEWFFFYLIKIIN